MNIQGWDVNSEELLEAVRGKKEYVEKFNKYISDCKNKFEQNKLNKKDIKKLVTAVSVTNNYDDIMFAVRVFLKYGKLKDAIELVDGRLNSVQVDKKVKLKLQEQIIKLKRMKQKIIVEELLNKGLGVKEVARKSGLSEEAVKRIRQNREEQER